MKLTDTLRKKIKGSKIKSRILRNPLPDSVLNSKLVKRMADRTAKTLTQLSEVAEKGKAMRAVRTSLKNKQAADTVNHRFNDIKSELEKVLDADVKAKAEKPAALKKTTAKPMPEMIRTKGGKHLPAAVARRAVRRSSAPGVTGFKAKKGQKKGHS